MSGMVCHICGELSRKADKNKLIHDGWAELKITFKNGASLKLQHCPEHNKEPFWPPFFTMDKDGNQLKKVNRDKK